ncbi:hypothetical protein LCGC14_2282650 [marine sediment metagenome]|uniref:Uncharacterized protein n=1 Tax=marine sediment metagenome TaxID=412755 RepID=A0A0F9CTG1_9ZZZZ
MTYSGGGDVKNGTHTHDLCHECRKSGAENARLQAALAELKQVGNEHYNNRIAVLETEYDRAEALAERRGAALEHIKGYPCPVCLPEQPDELCPYRAAIAATPEGESE